MMGRQEAELIVVIVAICMSGAFVALLYWALQHIAFVESDEVELYNYCNRCGTALNCSRCEGNGDAAN